MNALTGKGNQLSIISGQEGNAHDPYGWEELIFTKLDGTTYTLRLGSIGYEKYWINNEKFVDVIDGTDCEGLAVQCWEDAVGMTVALAHKIYARNYVEDPMGPASRYI